MSITKSTKHLIVVVALALLAGFTAGAEEAIVVTPSNEALPISPVNVNMCGSKVQALQGGGPGGCTWCPSCAGYGDNCCGCPSEPHCSCELETCYPIRESWCMEPGSQYTGWIMYQEQCINAVVTCPLEQ